MQIDLRIVYGTPQTDLRIRWGTLVYNDRRSVSTSDPVLALIDKLEGVGQPLRMFPYYLRVPGQWHLPHRLIVVTPHPATPGTLLVLNPNKSWEEQGVVSSCVIYLLRPGAYHHSSAA